MHKRHKILLIVLSEAALNSNNYNETKMKPSPKVYKSKIDDHYFHKEPVTSVNWIQTKQSSSFTYLSSISCDGKILFWNVASLLDASSNNNSSNIRYPVGGLLMYQNDSILSNSSIINGNPNSRSLFYGGIKMSLSSSSSYQYVGTVAGSIIRIQNKLLCNDSDGGKSNKKRKPEGIKLKWSNNAIQALHFAQLQHPSSSKSLLNISKLARYIEEKAMLKRKKGIDLACIYEIAKPSIDALYSCCINDNSTYSSSKTSFFEYASHNSSITSIQSIPFNDKDEEKKDLIITSSLDGELRLYSSLCGQPLEILNPSNIVCNTGKYSNATSDGSNSESCNRSVTMPLYDAQFSSFSPTVSIYLKASDMKIIMVSMHG